MRRVLFIPLEIVAIFRQRSTPAMRHLRCSNVPDILHNWLLRHVSPNQIIRSFSDIEQMYASIRVGYGLGLIHVRWGDTEAAFIRCSGNIEELSRPHTMLIAPDAYRRPEVKVFTKFFAPRYAATFN